MTPHQRHHVILAPLKVWVMLMLLLGLTLAYAYIPLAPLKLAASLGVAAIKAMLIASLFMQLRQAAGLVRMAALAGLVWTSFLYIVAFADYLTR